MDYKLNAAYQLNQQLKNILNINSTAAYQAQEYDENRHPDRRRHLTHPRPRREIIRGIFGPSRQLRKTRMSCPQSLQERKTRTRTKLAVFQELKRPDETKVHRVERRLDIEQSTRTGKRQPSLRRCIRLLCQAQAERDSIIIIVDTHAHSTK